MDAAAIVTLIGVGLIVAALAAYLIIIAYSLNKVSYTLGTVLIGVRAIAARCEPLNEVVSSITDDVAAIEQAMAALAAGRGMDEANQDQEEEEEEEPQYVEEEYEEYVEVEAQRPRRRRARVRR